MIGQTKLIRRLIMASLRPLTGVRASATATVNVATGHTEDVKLPKNCFAYPIPESAAGVADIDDQRLLRTTTEQIVNPGVASTVNVTSVLGGTRFNSLKAGERLLWDPPLLGLETHSVLATDMSGGVDPPTEHQAPVHDVTSFEEITSAELAQDLFQGRLQGRIPSVVISWDRSDESERKGRNALGTPERWNLFCVTENHQGEMARRDDGLNLADAVRDVLADRRTVDGAPFSDPPCTVFGRFRLAATESSLVYVVQLDTVTVAKRIDLRVPEQVPPGWVPDAADLTAFSDWDTTRYTLGTTDGLAIVDGAVYNQVQGDFNEDFNNDFDSL
ncbi:MAG: hypothetical protein V3W41_22010 [Planctomycetota bacterium]